MPFRLLVIDDEPDMLVLLRMILAERGRYEVVTTPNPLELEHILRDQEIHLVITDWRMPGRSGAEVLETVHGQDPDLPVIVITAYDSPENAGEAQKKGAFDYLPKPFRKDRILAAVEKGLAAYTEKKKIYW
ncbi:MAG: response regulator [Desulfobacterota bacterium]|jgi:DNA-binding NtrC family response regulator|nr:response regulator [Thermodesulfobacteriota bacterium]